MAKATPETKTIKLNHICQIPGAVGTPGDVVECSVEIAAKLVERRGAAYVTQTKTKTPAARAAANTKETK